MRHGRSKWNAGRRNRAVQQFSTLLVGNVVGVADSVVRPGADFQHCPTSTMAARVRVCHVTASASLTAGFSLHRGTEVAHARRGGARGPEPLLKSWRAWGQFQKGEAVRPAGMLARPVAFQNRAGGADPAVAKAMPWSLKQH